MANFTKRAIISTFLELVNKKSLDKITVKDIVDKCGINRNTFYYYYRDIYDLIENIFNIEGQKVIEKEGTEGSFYDELSEVIEIVLVNRVAIENMYYSKSRETIEKYLEIIADDFIRKYVKRKAENMEITEENLQFIIDCYSTSLRGVILKWIKDYKSMEADVFVQKLAITYESTIEEALKAFCKI